LSGRNGEHRLGRDLIVQVRAVHRLDTQVQVVPARVVLALGVLLPDALEQEALPRRVRFAARAGWGDRLALAAGSRGRVGRGQVASPAGKADARTAREQVAVDLGLGGIRDLALVGSGLLRAVGRTDRLGLRSALTLRVRKAGRVRGQSGGRGLVGSRSLTLLGRLGAENREAVPDLNLAGLRSRVTRANRAEVRVPSAADRVRAGSGHRVCSNRIASGLQTPLGAEARSLWGLSGGSDEVQFVQDVGG